MVSGLGVPGAFRLQVEFRERWHLSAFVALLYFLLPFPMFLEEGQFLESQDFVGVFGILAFWLGNMGNGVPENENGSLDTRHR